MPVSTLHPHYPDKASNKTSWSQLHGCSQDLLIANAAKEYKGLIVVITPDSHSGYSLEANINFFLGNHTGDKNKTDNHIPVHIFPDWETLPYDVFSPHEDLISDRLKTLSQLSSIEHGVLIVPVSTMMQRLAPVDYIRANSLAFKVGDKLNIEVFRRQLDESGYRNVTQVMEHGEYSTRGSLIDLFPMGNDKPYRIDLFDEDIETIRSFNPEDQRTIEQIQKIELLPAHEFPLNPEGISKFRENYSLKVGGDLARSQIYDNISNGNAPSGIEYYLPLFFDETATLFDYLPEKTLLINTDSTVAAAEAFNKSINDRYEQRRHDIERPLLPPQDLFLDTETLFDKISDYRRIETHHYEQAKTANNEATNYNYPVSTLPSLLIQGRSETPLILLNQFLVQFNSESKGRVLFTADSAGRRENLLGLLRDNRFDVSSFKSWEAFIESDAEMGLVVAPMENGVWIRSNENSGPLAIIPEAMLFGQQVQQKRRRQKPTRDADTIIRNLTDLTEGDPVVHEEHGVGRYQGMQTLTTSGIEQEFILLTYAKGDKLYVPVSSLHLISRYTGVSAEHAPLHTLGTEHWDKVRKKAAQKAHDIAAELLEIHARRAAQKGHAFPFNELEYLAFADTFPFEETPDQALAIGTVIKDMTSAQPMDRVTCGDVGFGKTEVAMRAAFVAANSGKQVALIAPTTLLVQQHAKNFRDRFADWPFKIGSLSRFKTAKETKATIEQMKSGNIDIVIGTHKLLQKDIDFKDLGLVIVDEEHRFGVRHKEQLKKLRANVDMLTLTATPIPRTLNMSLSGLRDLSIIATPPTQRHSIKTFVHEWDKSMIQEACARELARGGQVYFLHNEVKTIQKMTDDLSAILPDTKIRFAHGQMPERELESIMSDFYHQRFQVLVATTIIESGIDVPTANTILINRADKLGLAQLHQIRGRVGRSHHKAYAYLIIPGKKLISADAKKRLEAIESLEDLGVGFTLASHDLEIRGAGELLGDDQSGQIQEIGFNMYNDLLERAVKALKSGKLPDLDGRETRTTVDLGLPALIPNDYLPDVHNRLIMYKRIASAKDADALRELRVEMIDRFGLVPDEVKNLFEATRLKQIAQELGILKLDVGEEGGRVLFNEKPNIDPIKIMQLVQKRPWEFTIKGQDKLYFEYEPMMELDQRVQWVKRLFNDIKNGE
ncbi:transcription-repair coupling factor [Cocleimonas flava]|uniref:Transcription-repair-coupling factor n=1 Tax=Cocleimonas flava TaxID=634765 RepID=A0A4R1EV63_9GAMM|nr:transcription-repair coupling factor [Cocleimonas flava]TCJ84560.1 transcription-repair coupling factor [Cocleimonas flava]